MWSRARSATSDSPLRPVPATTPKPAADRAWAFLDLISDARNPMILAGALVALPWHGGGYGLIEWRNVQLFGRSSHVPFSNPEFSPLGRVLRCQKPPDLLPTMKQALNDPGLTVIDCPVGDSENAKLTARLEEMVCLL